jgi:hypothetical protein
MGRRRANATYFESHGVDLASGLSYGMDMTPLITDPGASSQVFVEALIQQFALDVTGRLMRLGVATSA